jgi:hypothetical protein
MKVMKKSIEQRAVDFAGDRSNGGGHGYPSWEATLIEKGYVKGAKDQKKLMYSEEEVFNLLEQTMLGSFFISNRKDLVEWFELFKKK